VLVLKLIIYFCIFKKLPNLKLKYFSLILCSTVFVHLKAQDFKILINENPLEFALKNTKDSMGAVLMINNMHKYYISKGYLGFSFDSITWSKNEVDIKVFIGQIYQIQSIESLIIDGKESTSINIKSYSGRYDSSKWFQNVNTILSQMENNGYPFSKVTVKTKPIKDEAINYVLEIERGEYFVYDTFQIEGDNVVNDKFLQAYLGLRKGQAYNESVFIKSHEKLNQLAFLRSERNPLMAFINGGKAKPYLYIKKRKSDQINGIIGMAPNSGSNSTKLLFTGEFNLKLNNLFKSAKALNINWRSFNARSQELKSSVNLPYLFYQPIGLDYHLEFLKFDTLFTNLSNQIGIQYYTSGVNGIKAIYINKSTTLNFVDTNSIKQSRHFQASIQFKPNNMDLNGFLIF
jgi:outer membrane protein assembly factor BamA